MSDKVGGRRGLEVTSSTHLPFVPKSKFNTWKEKHTAQ